MSLSENNLASGSVAQHQEFLCSGVSFNGLKLDAERLTSIIDSIEALATKLNTIQIAVDNLNYNFNNSINNLQSRVASLESITNISFDGNAFDGNSNVDTTTENEDSVLDGFVGAVGDYVEYRWGFSV